MLAQLLPSLLARVCAVLLGSPRSEDTADGAAYEPAIKAAVLRSVQPSGDAPMQQRRRCMSKEFGQ